MTLDGYQADVMRNKTWACWIFAGFVLSLGVARDCEFSFKDHITNELLLDHWFEIRYFQHPDETVKDSYTLLSILNIMCTSLKKYGDLYDNLGEEESRKNVKVSYGLMVSKILNLTNRTNVLADCERHACNSSFSKSYISPDELEKEFYKACAWNGTLPACPSPQSFVTTSLSPSQVSHATSTPSPTHSSTSTPSYTTIHQSTSTMTSSSLQPRNMTSPSAPNSTISSSSSQPRNMTSPSASSNCNTSLACHAHAFMGSVGMTIGPAATSVGTMTSSSSQPRNMTSLSASNNTETPPACQPTSSKNVTDNSGNMQERADDIPGKNKDNVLLSLLTVSCTVNVALLILVLWQCRNRRPNKLQDYSEEYHHYHNVELVYLRSEKKNHSEGNHEPPSEFTCLHKREQSEDNVNSSYSTT